MPGLQDKSISQSMQNKIMDGHALHFIHIVEHAGFGKQLRHALIQIHLPKEFQLLPDYPSSPFKLTKVNPPEA
jgi:hypothetical protein